MITEIITKEQPSQLTSYIIVVVKKGWAGLLCSAFTFYIFSQNNFFN